MINVGARPTVVPLFCCKVVVLGQMVAGPAKRDIGTALGKPKSTLGQVPLSSHTHTPQENENEKLKVKEDESTPDQTKSDQI